MESLGITRVAALHRFVHSLEEERAFLCDVLDFEEIALSSSALEAATQQRSAAFRAGSCIIVSSEPLSLHSAAGRFLQLHPEGIGGIMLDVEDIERAFRLVEARGGTPVAGIERDTTAPDGPAAFAVATPLNDVCLHFVTQRDYPVPLPGFVLHDAPSGGRNRFGFQSYDHLTSNFHTTAPAQMWLERVLGFQPFWSIQIHTGNERAHAHKGSGLRSVVMWDERSGVKFALNEPTRPNFKASQIYRYCEEQRGSGVQHAALLVEDIVHAVTQLRGRGVRFVSTPRAYYDRLPGRLAALGIAEIDEDLATLRDLEILIDGEGPGSYLLQIFTESVGYPRVGLGKSPFFFELIQRKGGQRFGEGNFRALFEGIESAQAEMGTGHLARIA